MQALKRLYQYIVRYQKARATRILLERLDERTLRDLALCREEITSIARESAGLAPQTRRRVRAGTAGAATVARAGAYSA